MGSSSSTITLDWQVGGTIKYPIEQAQIHSYHKDLTPSSQPKHYAELHFQHREVSVANFMSFSLLNIATIHILFK